MKNRTSEYRIWSGIKTRCYNPNYYAFNDYGGRGITMCDRWKNSFENFLADMGSRPSAKHSIDRYPNNDGNYEPENCRWATIDRQARNKRNNIFITHNGETLCLVDWARKLGIHRQTIKDRIFVYNWPIERALTSEDGRENPSITYNGQTKCLTHWAKELGIYRKTLASRLKAGWPIERAFTAPIISRIPSRV